MSNDNRVLYGALFNRSRVEQDRLLRRVLSNGGPFIRRPCHIRAAVNLGFCETGITAKQGAAIRALENETFIEQRSF